MSNSKFLGPLALDFNPQYNAVIGGRGTGKSTILEYIRWALCDQPPAGSEVGDGDIADFQRRRMTLIEGTLLPIEAVVDVWFLLNGVQHVVRRKASGELTLQIGDAGFHSCTEQNVRDLLPIRAYSQKQLSAVGARLDELRRFVHAPIQTELDKLEAQIAGLSADLRAAFDRVIRHRKLSVEAAAHDIERQSLNEQGKHLSASLKGLSADDRAIIDRHSIYEADQRVVQALERDARAAKDALATVALEFQRLPAPIEKRTSRDRRSFGDCTHLIGPMDVHGARGDRDAPGRFHGTYIRKSLGPVFGRAR